MAWKVVVDFDLCESNAICMGIVPEVFEVRDDNFLYVLQENPPDDATLIIGQPAGHEQTDARAQYSARPRNQGELRTSDLHITTSLFLASRGAHARPKTPTALTMSSSVRGTMTPMGFCRSVA